MCRRKIQTTFSHLVVGIAQRWHFTHGNVGKAEHEISELVSGKMPINGVEVARFLQRHRVAFIAIFSSAVNARDQLKHAKVHWGEQPFHRFQLIANLRVPADFRADES